MVASYLDLCGKIEVTNSFRAQHVSQMALFCMPTYSAPEGLWLGSRFARDSIPGIGVVFSRRCPSQVDVSAQGRKIDSTSCFGREIAALKAVE